MKKHNSSKLFLEEVAKVPIVQVACEKVGLSRNTVYRWRKEDPDFAFKMDAAMTDGIEYISDVAESQLLNMIKGGQFGAVAFWLRTHKQKYKSVKSEVVEEPPTLDAEIVGRALETLVEHTKESMGYESAR